MITQKHYLLFTSLVYVMLFVGLMNTQKAHAADSVKRNMALSVNPGRCVALRQGQTCYQEVLFSWTQPQKGNFCLINLSTKQILKCWQNAHQGKFELDFQSSTTNAFALRTKGQDIDLSSTRIVVSWVFKSSKRPKSSWRLF